MQEDENGKPLVFRDSMISNIRDLVDVVPRLNIFGDDELARLCEQVKEKIASVEPDALRPSKSFDPIARARVKRDADELMEKFAGYPKAEPGFDVVWVNYSSPPSEWNREPWGERIDIASERRTAP